jgi:ribokinase
VNTMVQIKRIYDPPAPENGFRVLVDRAWPRGVEKVDAARSMLKQRNFAIAIGPS